LHTELTRSFVDRRMSVLSRSLKQDIILGTEIKNKNEVIIDGQYIGKLKGMKLDLDFKSSSLKTDIKSLKKAARQAISPELLKRANKIIEGNELKLDANHKIYWMDYPIAYLEAGKDYLNPKLKILVDDAIDLESKEKLQEYLEKWLNLLIKKELSDLVSLSNSKSKNNYERALCYQLFENNGIIKRENVFEIIKNISKENRINLRKAGVKIGRYHIFLPRMLKPNAVNLRINLLKVFFKENEKAEIPKSGLNFLQNQVAKNKKFLLICGFENFDKFYVRIDILERLFLQIIEKSKDGKFKINSDMINLVGCSKENFFKLLELMRYKRHIDSKTKEESFIYSHNNKKRNEKKFVKNRANNSAFSKLSEIRFR